MLNVVKTAMLHVDPTTFIHAGSLGLTRYANASWKQQAELLNAGRKEDIWCRKIRDARSPSPEKFVPQV